MSSIISQLKDQAPRAMRVGVLAFLAGMLLYLDHPGQVGPLPAPLYVGLLYAGLITPAAVATALFLPALTRLSDAVQIARLMFAAAVALVPGAFRALADQPLINATVVIMGGMAIVAMSQHRPGLAALGVSAPQKR